MTTVQEFERWKKKIEGLERQVHRAEGALDNLRQKLKDPYGCSSIEEAEQHLSQLKKDCRKRRDELDHLLMSFQKKWGSILDD